MRKLLYVEFSTAHTEIIYSTLKALESDYEITLLIHEKSKPRVENLPARFKIETLNDQNYLKRYLDVYEFIQTDVVLLNSTQGRKARNIALRSLFKKAKFFGFHHNPENLYHSFTQKIVNLRFKKYLVLSDEIKNYLKDQKSIQVESFYPLLYDDREVVRPVPNYKYFCVPGVLELSRRDYLGLIGMVADCGSSWPLDYKVVLLGNSQNHDGPLIQKMIVDRGLQDKFILFNEYVLDPVMLGYIQNCSAILPLITPRIHYFQEYFHTKISGAYNLAFAYTKPLLMDLVYQDKTEFDGYRVLIDSSDFLTSLHKAVGFSVQKKSKYQFELQKNRLIEFLQN